MAQEPPPIEAISDAFSQIGPASLQVVHVDSQAYRRWAWYLSHHHYLGLRVVGQNIGYLGRHPLQRPSGPLLSGGAHSKRLLPLCIAAMSCAALLEIEKEVLEEGREWTRQRLAQRLQATADAIAALCPQSRVLLKRQQPCSFSLMTVSGPVRIRAIRGYSKATQSWHCPVREQWGLENGPVSVRSSNSGLLTTRHYAVPLRKPPSTRRDGA